MCVSLENHLNDNGIISMSTCWCRLVCPCKSCSSYSFGVDHFVYCDKCISLRVVLCTGRACQISVSKKWSDQLLLSLTSHLYWTARDVARCFVDNGGQKFDIVQIYLSPSSSRWSDILLECHPRNFFNLGTSTAYMALIALDRKSVNITGFSSTN